jgi:hypothetical protein
VRVQAALEFERRNRSDGWYSDESPNESSKARHGT